MGCGRLRRGRRHGRSSTVFNWQLTLIRPSTYSADSIVVPNLNLPGLFFVYRICFIIWHSQLNDMEIPETKCFIPKGFELGTTLS